MRTQITLTAGFFRLNLNTLLRGEWSEGWLEVELPSPIFSRELHVPQGDGEFALLPSKFIGFATEVAGLAQGSGWT